MVFTLFSNYLRGTRGGRSSNDPKPSMARHSFVGKGLLLSVLLFLYILMVVTLAPILGGLIGTYLGLEDECHPCEALLNRDIKGLLKCGIIGLLECDIKGLINYDINGLLREIPTVTISPSYYLNCIVTALVFMKVMQLLYKIGRTVALCCFPCLRSKKGHASRGLAGTLEGALDRPVPGWDGAWVDFGKALRRLALPCDWELTPEQALDPGWLVRRLSEECFSYEDPYSRITVLCWGLASAYRLAMDHPQRVETRTENGTMLSKTHVISVQPTKSRVPKAQQRNNTVPRTGVQAIGQAVNLAPAKTTVEAQSQTEATTASVCSVETQTQAATLDKAVSAVLAKTAVEAQSQTEATTASVCSVETQTQAASLDKAISAVPATTTAEIQTQAEANTASACSVETQTQATDLEVAISTEPTKTTVEAQTQADANTAPIRSVETQTQAVDLEVAISIKPARTTVEAQTQADANTALIRSAETQTQTADTKVAISTKPTKTTVEAQTQADANTVPIRSMGTQTQATKRKITIAPVKKRTPRMKETTKPIEPPLQLEQGEEEEEQVEEEEEEEAGEGAAAREEETAVTMEGVTTREERVVTVEEGAKTREGGVVTVEEGVKAREGRVVTVEEGAAAREGGMVVRDGAHLMGLGARPKETRGMFGERKEPVQATWDRIGVDDWCSDYIRTFPVEDERRSMRFRQPEEGLFQPLHRQPSFGGVIPPLRTRPTFEGIDDRERPLPRPSKDYVLPTSIGADEQRRSSFPRGARARSLSPRLERARSPSPRRGRRRSPSPRSERHRSSSSRYEQSSSSRERVRNRVGEVPRKSGRVKTQVERIVRGRDGQEVMRESEIIRSLTPKEIRDIRRDYSRLSDERILTWLVRCWDKGANSHVLEGHEAQQLGSLARDHEIEQELAQGERASSLWTRILHAVRARYPFKEYLMSAPRKWNTAEEGIQYLRELAMLEIIYADPKYYDILVPEKMPCTQPMWDKVLEGAPDLYLSCLINAYPISMDENEIHVDRMCQWIRRISETMRVPSKLQHSSPHREEGVERHKKHSVYEEEPRGKDSRGRKERSRSHSRSSSRSRSRSRSPHATRGKTGSPRSKTQSKRNVLWTTLRGLGENMEKWHGESTSKLEARLQELKQKIAGKKAVHVVEAKTSEKKHRSSRHKRSNSLDSDEGASDRTSLKSDGECSDQEQQ